MPPKRKFIDDEAIVEDDPEPDDHSDVEETTEDRAFIDNTEQKADDIQSHLEVDAIFRERQEPSQPREEEKKEEEEESKAVIDSDDAREVDYALHRDGRPRSSDLRYQKEMYKRETARTLESIRLRPRGMVSDADEYLERRRALSRAADRPPPLFGSAAIDERVAANRDRRRRGIFE